MRGRSDCQTAKSYLKAMSNSTILRRYSRAYSLISRVATFAVAVGLAHSVASAQATGDFRSKKNGKWDQKQTWQTWDGTKWKNATRGPALSDGVITIKHQVEANVRGNYDQVVISAAGQLTVTQGFRIRDGAGIDLQVYGSLIANRSVRIKDFAEVEFYAGSTTVIALSRKLRFEELSKGVFENGALITVNGTFQVEDFSEVDLNSGVYLTSPGRVFVRDDAVLTVSESTILNQNKIDVWQSSSLIFENGGKYIHDLNGSNFPLSVNTIWNDGSEAQVIGVTNALPTNLDDTYDSFIWNSSSQTADLDVNSVPVAINGDLSVLSTGSGSLTWAGTGGALSVGGNFVQTNGDFRFVDAGAGTMTVAGDFEVSGGTFDIAKTSGNPILDVNGDFTVTGTVTESGSGFGTILLSGSAPQTIIANSTLSGNVDLTVAASATAVLGADLLVPGHLMETSGGLNLNNFDVEIEGDLGITSSLSNPGQITFSSSNAAELQLPSGSSALPYVVIDKPASSLTLLSDTETSTTIIVRNGTLDTNGFELLIPHGTTLHNNGVVSGGVTLTRLYSQNSDGWRMLASPVSGINYSNLNAAFWTQGASWADEASGVANLQSFSFGTQDWSELNGGDSGFSAGLGYIFYMYAEDDSGASILPATWTVSGNPGSLGTQSLQFSTGISDSYNLKANPSTTNIDWNLTWASSTNMESSYATWDPSVTTEGGTTGYKYYDANSGIGAAGRYIPPFTAFMVAANAVGAQIAFSSSEAAASQNAVYYGKNEEIAPYIRLRMEGQGLAENEMYLSFGDEATDHSGQYDVERLIPLSSQFATIWSTSVSRRLAFDGRTMSSGREVYDLTVAATRPGTYKLVVEELYNIPGNWNMKLYDLQTGNSQSISKDQPFEFHTSSRDVVSLSNRLNDFSSPRFRLVLEDPDQALEELESQLLQASTPVLSQNYPNPFNPTTSIRFSVPESAPVSLEVFDALGRRIEVLVDRTMNAGWHSISWNASDFASGMYYYRLVVGSQALSKSMILMR